MPEDQQTTPAIATEARIDAADVLPLYDAVGWTAYTADPAGLQAALDGSDEIVAARLDGRVVGLARVLTDGATVCYLQDILVHPDWQRSGLGAALVSAVLEPFAHVRQKVLLTDAEPGQRAFYEQAGFVETYDHPAGLRAFVRFDALRS